MTILGTIGFILILLGSVYIVVNLGLKLILYWKRTQEESIFHLGLLFVYLGLNFTIFGLILTINIPFTIEEVLTLPIGVLCCFFYLELSFFYLSFFSNSNTIFVKYISIINITSIVYTLITIFNVTFIEIAFYLQVIIFILGVYIIINFIYRLHLRKQYLMNIKQKNFVNYLMKILFIVCVAFVLDGLCYLSMWKIQYYVNDIILLIFGIFFLIFLFGINSLLNNLKKVSKDIEVTSLLNILS